MKHTKTFNTDTHKIEIEYSLIDGRFSMSAGVWERNKYGRLEESTFGQCLDYVLELLPNEPLVNRMVKVWSRYHLNDMNAGSPKQMEYLRANPITFKYPESHYEVASKVLSEVGLNPDNGYKYGSAWLKEELPIEVVNEIQSWSKE